MHSDPTFNFVMAIPNGKDIGRVLSESLVSAASNCFGLKRGYSFMGKVLSRHNQANAFLTVSTWFVAG